MRVGQNPAKAVNSVAQPADLTVTVVNCIPFLSGFYQHNLEVLKTCLYSIRNSTDRPLDLMVFDNHSCKEVRQFLTEAYEAGVIQYLVLSDTNIGKIGAWNFMFGAAQGNYIAFADGDILFREGWLSAALELFEAFPKVGMVTGRPVRPPEKYSSTTFNWARQQNPGILEEGTFIPWDVFLEHSQSLGIDGQEALDLYHKGKDYRLTFAGKQAYIGSTHFQFLSSKEVLKKVIPLPSEKPMRGERILDSKIDELGYLHLCTCEATVLHMGNRTPSEQYKIPVKQPQLRFTRRLLRLPGIRHALMWIYNKIFKLYFDNVE